MIPETIQHEIKKTWGGARTGAGRKKDTESIRGRLEAFRNHVEDLHKKGKEPKHGWNSLHRLRCESYVKNHAGPWAQLYHILEGAPDRRLVSKNVNGWRKGFITWSKAALMVKHLDIETQVYFLRPLIDEFIRQYENDGGVFGDKARSLRDGTPEVHTNHITGEPLFDSVQNSTQIQEPQDSSVQENP